MPSALPLAAPYLKNHNSMHIVYPVAIRGTSNHWVIELVHEIGRRATLITWRTQRIHLSVPAVVNSPPKGK